jgi:hypothetical protein
LIQVGVAKVDGILQEVRLSGFNLKGNAVIRIMADGSIYLVLDEVPPFAGFDRQLEQAIGVPVVWDDREVLVISHPRPDTAERIRGFIESYRADRGRGRGLWGKGKVMRLIVASLTPVVRPAEFRFRKKAEGFVRTIEGGRQELGIALWNYNPLFRFSLTLCVRLEAVQEIINRFSGSPPEYHGTTLTSVTQLEFLGLPAEGGGVEYRATSEHELAAVLPGVAAMVRERVVPFFNEYWDVAALNRGLNPDGAEVVTQLPWPRDRRTFDASQQPYRAMSGAAVARLAGDPRWEKLVGAYRAQVAGMAEDDCKKFESLVAYLAGE